MSAETTTLPVIDRYQRRTSWAWRVLAYLLVAASVLVIALAVVG